MEIDKDEEGHANLKVRDLDIGYRKLRAVSGK